ncbi:Zwei Ig domain protein zig-8 [Eumeta japonica]|uniref:Zwei Ig domain protein zig-8 n=1 Tax=Eumeta variegata TaxID=151549 RepID=A0A4C1WR57_EUMVA|nr:Zwei Ig domain protein zig-8 [Eumeta japonica]
MYLYMEGVYEKFRGCGWESLMKNVTLGNVTMSHRTREARRMPSLSHSTMIGLPRAALELIGKRGKTANRTEIETKCGTKIRINMTETEMNNSDGTRIEKEHNARRALSQRPVARRMLHHPDSGNIERRNVLAVVWISEAEPEKKLVYIFCRLWGHCTRGSPCTSGRAELSFELASSPENEFALITYAFATTSSQINFATLNGVSLFYRNKEGTTSRRFTPVPAVVLRKLIKTKFLTKQIFFLFTVKGGQSLPVGECPAPRKRTPFVCGVYRAGCTDNSNGLESDGVKELDYTDVDLGLHQRGPYFDVAFSKNVTALVGKTAQLNCRVHELGNRTVSWTNLAQPAFSGRSKAHAPQPSSGREEFTLVPLFVVSWIRHRDIHLLTSGRMTYTSDQRFVSVHNPHTEDWILKIRFPQRRDSGVYECQVGTTPPIGHRMYLSVVEPVTTILGGPELFINMGSTINLTCVVQHSPEPPPTIRWTHNEEEVEPIIIKIDVLLAKVTLFLTMKTTPTPKLHRRLTYSHDFTPTNALPRTDIVFPRTCKQYPSRDKPFAPQPARAPRLEIAL